MARLKQHFARWPLALVILLSAGGAFGIARSVWDFDPFYARQAASKASCQNNLKQLGLALKMHANESRGEIFPALTSTPGNIMFRKDQVYPRYLDNDEIMICPGPVREAAADVFNDDFYVYTGYLIRNEQDLDAFAVAYTAELGDGADFSTDLLAQTSYGNTLFRIREGIERVLVTDINDPRASTIQSTIPVLWEWPDNHMEGAGGNVLYMDGHVEWVAFPGKFPMTEHTLTSMAALAGYTPPTAWHGREIESDYVGYSPLPSACVNNFKVIGLTGKMFANESQGAAWPVLSNTPGKLMMESSQVFPEYIREPEVFTCPGREVLAPAPFFDDVHYVYLGYLLTNDQDVQQFSSAYQQVIASGGNFSGNLPIASSYSTQIFRLREGIERILITDINSPIPPGAGEHNIVVAFEWPENHIWNSGGHVLYMDGHVEWVEYPGEFPMTVQTISTLRTLAQNTPATSWRIREDGPEDKYGYIRDCKYNLGLLGSVNKWYANNSLGEYHPHLSATRGQLIQRQSEVPLNDFYYDLDFDVTTCPGVQLAAPATALDDNHYMYLGYFLPTEADVLAFASAYAGAAVVPEGDINIPSSYGPKILRIKEGVENSPNPVVSQSNIPVMIEWPGNHEGETGGHVLYMDGHVEWHDYPGDFPMTENVIQALDGIANWTPATAWNVPPLIDLPVYYTHTLCFTNERSFGQGFKMYANEAAGQYFPPLSPQGGLLATEDPRFYKYYLGDIRRLNCPASTMAYSQTEIHDENYVYVGYVIPDQATLERFAVGYQQQIASGGDFTGNLLTGAETVYRLREGVERFFITDINNPASSAYFQKKLPVMIEWPDNHVGVRGGNVLYLDGHTEWIDYPGKFPMTEQAIAVLIDLADRGPIREVETIQEGPSRLEKLLSLDGVNSRR